MAWIEEIIFRTRGQNMEYVDVYDTNELPVPKDGWRYLDFLGGEKQKRCFLVPRDYPRCDFFMEYADLLDDSLQPIYANNGIFVRQDASFAVPGLYIISYDKQYSAFDYVDDVLLLRTFFIIKKIREGMRTRLGINYIHMYYEEKIEKSCNVHYWLMPLYQPDTPIIFKIKIMEYLRSFDFAEERERINKYNRIMMDYFEEINLKKMDDQILMQGGKMIGDVFR